MKLFPTDAEYGDIYKKYPVPQLTLIDPKIEAKFSAHASLIFGGLDLPPLARPIRSS